MSTSAPEEVRRMTAVESLNGADAPAVVLEYDASAGRIRCVSAVREGSGAAWVLVRHGTAVVGRLLIRGPIGDDARAIELVESRLRAELAAARRNSQQASPTVLTAVTAVVCTTAARPDALRRCLDSLGAQDHPAMEILIVDNSPAGAGWTIAREYLVDRRYRYVTERRQGLANARNASVRLSTSPILAWIDDDEVADQHWVSGLLRAFAEVPDADVVCGLMAPAALDTPAQIWFEQWGGHSKGRGFRREIYRGRRGQDPLYPLPAFGSGGNMAYRRSALEAMGGFDPALGAGTRSGGAEDTRAFTETLLGGGTMVFEPAAVTFHYHRESEAELEKQLVAYGSGLTAFYTSILRSHPSEIVNLVRLLPRALRDLRSDDSVRNATLPDDFPAGLMGRNLTGMLRGPGRYLKDAFRSRSLFEANHL